MHKFESLDADEALGPPKETPEEFRARILLAAAVKLYEVCVFRPMVRQGWRVSPAAYY